MSSVCLLTISLVCFSAITLAEPPAFQLKYLCNAYKDLKQQIQNCTGNLLCDIVTYDKGLFGNSVTCIPKSKICDHKLDCALGEDEVGCAPNCKNIRCQDGKNCATPCDENSECEGGEDERGCRPDCKCPKKTYRCKDGRTCVLRSKICDGRSDCPGGDDEFPCPNNCSCPEGNLRCADGVTCVPHAKFCDGKMDCPDNDDERNCPRGCNCRPNELVCLSGQKCLPRADICNGVPGECCNVATQCIGSLNEDNDCVATNAGG